MGSLNSKNTPTAKPDADASSGQVVPANIADPVEIEMLDSGPDGLRIQHRAPGTRHIVDGSLARHYVKVLEVAKYVTAGGSDDTKGDTKGDKKGDKAGDKKGDKAGDKAGGEKREPAPGAPQDRAIGSTPSRDLGVN